MWIGCKSSSDAHWWNIFLRKQAKQDWLANSLTSASRVTSSERLANAIFRSALAQVVKVGARKLTNLTLTDQVAGVDIDGPQLKTVKLE